MGPPTSLPLPRLRSGAFKRLAPAVAAGARGGGLRLGSGADDLRSVGAAGGGAVRRRRQRPDRRLRADRDPDPRGREDHRQGPGRGGLLPRRRAMGRPAAAPDPGPAHRDLRELLEAQGREPAGRAGDARTISSTPRSAPSRSRRRRARPWSRSRRGWSMTGPGGSSPDGCSRRACRSPRSTPRAPRRRSTRRCRGCCSRSCAGSAPAAERKAPGPEKGDVPRLLSPSRPAQSKRPLACASMV